jgi:cell wall-associated NlpC family hydrolase
MEKRHRTLWLGLGLVVMAALSACTTGRTPAQKQAAVRAWTGPSAHAPQWRKADKGPIASHMPGVAQPNKTTTGSTTATGGATPATPKHTIKATDKVVQTLIAEAQSYLGTPYAWGGMSRKGMDCSGFAVIVYRAVGVELPRISPDQYKYGKDVPLKQVQPGDLLFFWNYKPGVIGHTAICVEVNDGVPRFIHAASSGVRYDDLNLAYWNQRFMCASRVLGTKEQASR